MARGLFRKLNNPTRKGKGRTTMKLIELCALCGAPADSDAGLCVLCAHALANEEKIRAAINEFETPRATKPIEMRNGLRFMRCFKCGQSARVSGSLPQVYCKFCNTYAYKFNNGWKVFDAQKNKIYPLSKERVPTPFDKTDGATKSFSLLNKIKSLLSKDKGE